MSATDSLLEVVLSGLQDAALDALAGASIARPASVKLTHTKPVADWRDDGSNDQMLAVWIERIDARPFGERRPSSPGEGQLAGFHTVVLARVEYHACHPNLGTQGEAPEDDALTEAADTLARAGWAIWCELVARRDAGSLFTTLGSMRFTRADVGIGSMTPLPPTGYDAGWQINLEVAVPAVFEDSPPGS